MKPLQQQAQDAAALEELGRASVQIVHDLKNQLNGLKLYATFLRKRIERAERPADELETVDKIIAGLERAAADTSALVRFGRPVELRRAAQTDLAELLHTAAGDSPAPDVQGGPFRGDFDRAGLAEAFGEITSAARDNNTGGAASITLRRDGAAGGASHAVIEWSGAPPAAGGGFDLFNSFAGRAGLRLALAGKIVRAHGGAVTHEADTVSVRLPLSE